MSLWLFGLQHASSAIATSVTLPRVLAAAISLTRTGTLMIGFKAVHPPAGATTLIVSLGLVTRPADLIIIEA